MSSVIEDFFSFPSDILLERCTKEEMLQIAECFGGEVTSNDKKLRETLLKAVKDTLVERGVLEIRTPPVNPDTPLTSPLYDPECNVKCSEMSLQEKQLCVDSEKFCAERDICALKQKELEKDIEFKKLQQLFELRKLELQFKQEREREFQLRKLELEQNAKTVETPIPVSPDESVHVTPVFDVYKNISAAVFREGRREVFPTF